MQVKIIFFSICALFLFAELGWSCNQTTYAGCSPDQLRAIQQQQFYARKGQTVSAEDYWRDRQYVDRVRLEERNHELQIERIRAEAAIEVARQERRSWRRGGYYFYRPPVVVKPTPPVVSPPKPAPPVAKPAGSNMRMVRKVSK